jgi:hypothetical protein
MSLTKINNQLAFQTDDSEYMRAVIKALAIMRQGGLKLYGQEPGPDAWFMALVHRGVQIHEITPAVAAYVSGQCGSEFPTAGQFANWILEHRENLELRAELAAMGKRIREQDESALRQRNLDKYGTEDPSLDQIHARALAEGFAPILNTVIPQE